MSLVSRILNYLAQELIVNNLANSRAFQRGALRVHEVVTESKQKANQLLQEAQKKLEQSEFQTHQNQAVTFFSTFKKSILEDIEAIKRQTNQRPR